ncbi:MAG: DUF11 domain-containing protein [Candidatus Kerfeldbacteria bacterium]|nr:DUF11 domain-containing protein [Candidatus Kerfeldbacteria bacterium]
MKQYLTKTLTVASLIVSGALLASTAAAQNVVGPSPEQPIPLTKPVLEVTKTADTSTTVPGGIVTYTVTVKNTGDAAAQSLKLEDIMPVGLSLTTTGKNTFTYTFLGELEPGKTVSTSYSAKVDKNIAAFGEYVNVVSVSAANHNPIAARSSVTVKAPEVKGVQTKTTTQPTASPPEGEVLGAETLTDTGVGQLDVFLALLGAGLIGTGFIGLRKANKSQ